MFDAAGSQVGAVNTCTGVRASMLKHFLWQVPKVGWVNGMVSVIYSTKGKETWVSFKGVPMPSSMVAC